MLFSTCEDVLSATAILLLFIFMFAATVFILRSVLKANWNDVATFEVFASGIFTFGGALIVAINPRAYRPLIEKFIVTLRSYTTNRHMRDPIKKARDIGISAIFLMSQLLSFWWVFSNVTQPDHWVQTYRSFVNTTIVQPLFGSSVCANREQASTNTNVDWNTLTIRTNNANYFCILVAPQNSADPNSEPSAWQQVIPADTYNAFDGSNVAPNLRNLIDVTPRRGTAIIEVQNGVARLVLNLYDLQFYVRYGDITSIQEIILANQYGEREVINLQNTPGHFIVNQRTFQPLSEDYQMPVQQCIGG
jgi:hypothetical protein